MKEKRVAGIAFLLVMMLFSMNGYGQEWTEQSARQQAFSTAQQALDMTRFPTQDPNFTENQRAIHDTPAAHIGNRFVTAAPPSQRPIGYVVSTLDDQDRQVETMYYEPNGRLFFVRLFSSPEYPRTAAIYCGQDECLNAGTIYRKGQLVSVTFQVSESEEFVFDPTGLLRRHEK